VCSCGSFTCSHLLLGAFFILRLFLSTSPPHFAPYRSCASPVVVGWSVRTLQTVFKPLDGGQLRLSVAHSPFQVCTSPHVPLSIRLLVAHSPFQGYLCATTRPSCN
jgi:hypothetical protein